MFVPSKVDDSVVDAVIKHYFGTAPATADAISKQFQLSKYNDQKLRIKALFQFSTFTCSNRWLTEAYAGKTYNLQYSRGSGIHGSDIAADFYKGPSIITSMTDPTFDAFATTFQSYLTSHARTGDPNKLRDKNGIDWPIATLGATIGNVLNATNTGYQLISDLTTKAEDCDFWKDVLAGMTNSLGKSPIMMNLKSGLELAC
jgi:carboxylesterase type B